ncbi:hypothetical protein [Cohnella zeiphila]|uniref:Uncharacterized protein n=1 Tax=Cohnella zeiphila TaxID=2761120 RepID=A0A7X0SVP1_9BACL|nr:hypothetical protein [Cohnella zeiphila]MBB6736019.1 hypothetical protein [Cohnella zeiphila]
MKIHAFAIDRKRILSGLLLLLVGGFLFVEPAGAASARPLVPASAPIAGSVLGAVRLAPPAGLAANVASWIQALSAQKPFTQWKQANTRIEALGPGTHGWLVTLTGERGQPVGYLIAYAAPDGTYRLGEYGLGSQPLFDRNALTRTLVENGLLKDAQSPYIAEKSYVHPFAAVWVVRIGPDTYWADAKSTELLPLDDSSWQKATAYTPPQAVVREASVPPQVGQLRLGEPFDPYERLPWLSGVQPVGQQNEAEVTDRLDRGLHLRYVSEPFGDRMLYALPAIGYLKWGSGRIDIALDMNGTRFIPLSVLRQTGLFYP